MVRPSAQDPSGTFPWECVSRLPIQEETSGQIKAWLALERLGVPPGGVSGSCLGEEHLDLTFQAMARNPDLDKWQKTKQNENEATLICTISGMTRSFFSLSDGQMILENPVPCTPIPPQSSM